MKKQYKSIIKNYKITKKKSYFQILHQKKKKKNIVGISSD